ncbi:MAG: GNAT family N-acetyltransferase [Planctomycetota bacterium]|nr:MAG: GNAT family N-acetyltransferase [Planctomycetota bacterium]
MRTIPLTIKHAHDIANLHIQGINTGFISSLGVDFVTALYEAIAKSTSSFGYAVEDNDKVLGFVTFTTNLNKLYKSIIAKKGWRFALLLAGKMFSLDKIKKVFETLFYPSRIKKKMNVPSAELLSIAINPETCRRGLATQLVKKGFEYCQRMGLDKVKVLVAADNEPANRLYLKCGFKLVGQIDNHGITSNVYEAQTSKALNENLTDDKSSRPSLSPDFAQRRQAPVPTPEPVTGTVLGAGSLITITRKRQSVRKRRSA